MQAFPSCLLISQLLSSFRRDRIRSFTQAVCGVCVCACVWCVHVCGEYVVHVCGVCVCAYGVCVQSMSRGVCVIYDTSTCEEVHLQVGNALLLIHVRY